MSTSDFRNVWNESLECVSVTSRIPWDVTHDLMNDLKIASSIPFSGTWHIFSPVKSKLA